MIDRVPDELWTEVHDIVQETGIKTMPKKKKWKKEKWLSGEALQRPYRAKGRPFPYKAQGIIRAKKDVLFVIGNWNAKVGSQETPGVTGKFGLGVQNEAGQKLREFCKRTHWS